ncbi:MAG TPA: M36 family metallopeptidase [Thermoanaerobaculia bacterium]
MRRTFPGKRSFVLTIAAASLAVLALAHGAAAAPAGRSETAGNYDARVMGGRGLGEVLAESFAVPLKGAPTRTQLAGQIKTMRRALERLQKTAPGASARFSPITAAPEMVSGDRAPLSAPASGRLGIDIVRDFLRANSALYGLTGADVDALHFLGESVSSKSGLRMVRVEQRLNGLPVFESETRFILDREGRVWRSLGLLVPSGATAPVPPRQPQVSAPEALARAMSSVGIDLDVSRMRSETKSAAPAEDRIVVRDERIAGEVRSDLVYFPVAPGRLVPAWRQIAFTVGDDDWFTLVDAATGVVLWRKDVREHVSTQQARFSVYVQGDGVTPADSPAPHSPTTVTPGAGTQFPGIARAIVDMSAAQDITASPDGWIPDGGTTTTGNNVDACVDRIVTPVATERNVCDIGTIDNNGRPVGNPDANGKNRDFLGATPRDFSYSPAPLGGNPNAGDEPTGTGTTQVNFRRGSVTQAFYVANWYHDRLFNLGFDEAAGNFQNTNFSGMGVGNDRLRVDVQDGQGQNVPSFSTPPDGASGRLTLHRFIEPVPDRDSALDADIIIHELTHGTTNRLIGNAGGLTWSVGRALGEGWSDFYALALLNNTNADDPDANYAFGAYTKYQSNHLTDNYLYGPRRYPYSTDNTVNPLTWADTDDVTADISGGIAPSPLGGSINGGLDIFNAGEVWALSLWEVRSRIIADPAGANGDVPTGNATMLQLVTDALKMTPSHPSFTDARDALILADCATNGCANERSIWEGFADRGLGYGAVAPLGQVGFLNIGHMSLGESFSLPHLDVAASTADDVLGNKNGAIDPGEIIRVAVQLANPWRNPAYAVQKAKATLTSSTLGVTILDRVATYRALPGQDLAATNGFLFKVSTGAVCGQSLKFTLTTESSLGTATADFTLRVGAPAGTGAPVIFTRTISPGLAIPDGDRRGVVDTLTVTDDLEIADLDFRVDDLQHTFTGDLTVLLKAPNGYGTDLIWMREAGLLGGGDGDNFIDPVIDDESRNDLNQSSDTDAPYTGHWAPAFNSQIWRLFASPAIFPDPVGQLSRLDGTNTQGPWKVLVADIFGPETGTLNSWSLIVTPTAFTCKAFAPGADQR